MAGNQYPVVRPVVSSTSIFLKTKYYFILYLLYHIRKFLFLCWFYLIFEFEIELLNQGCSLLGPLP